MAKRFLGPVYIAIAASLWGLSGALAKVFFTHDIDPLVVVQTRSSFAFLLLAPLVLWRRDWLILSPRQLLRILPLGVLGVAASNFAYYYAVAKTTVAAAIILQYTAPVLVAGYQVFFEKRRLSPGEILLILLVLLGGYTTVTGWESAASLFGQKPAISGLLAGVGSAFSWAFFNLYGHRLDDISPPAKLYNSLLFATLFWSLVQSPKTLASHIPDARVFWLLMGFACLSVLLPYAFYFAGLKLSGSLPAILTANCEPVMAIFFSALLVQAVVTPVQMVGALTVIAGATLFNIKNLNQEVQLQ